MKKNQNKNIKSIMYIYNDKINNQSKKSFCNFLKKLEITKSFTINGYKSSWTIIDDNIKEVK